MGAYRRLEQIVQTGVFLQTDARRAEGNRLRMLAARIGTGGEVGGDDFTAYFGAIDLHLLQPDLGTVPAGVEDLNKFAVFQMDRGRFAIAKPHEQDKRRQGQRQSEEEPAPEMARLFAFFLHGSLFLQFRRTGRATPGGSSMGRPTQRALWASPYSTHPARNDVEGRLPIIPEVFSL